MQKTLSPCPRRLRQKRLNPHFSSARLLLEQGKYDEAISQLQSLSASNPALKGLARELGVAITRRETSSKPR